MIWLLVSRPVPSSRSLGSFDFPRIGLRAGCGAPFLSAHSPASFRDGGVYRFPFRLVFPSRLPVSCGRLVSILCGSLANPFHLVDLPVSRCSVSPRRSVSCSSVLLVVSRCLVLPGLSSPLVSPGVSLSSPCSLVSLGRLVSAARRAGCIICHPFLVSFSFCSCIISLVASHDHGDGGLSCPLSRGGVALAEWSCRSTIRETHRFCQLDFPIR